MESITTPVRRRAGRIREIELQGQVRYISVPALASRWGLSEAHTYRLIDRGFVPHVRFGHSIRVELVAVEAHEAAHRDGGAA